MPLSQAENDVLTRVGRGQPAGELLRRYWMPVAIARELTADSPTKFVRVLGEDLVLFRDQSGRVLDPFGEAIPGLYVAGELGSVVGSVYPAPGAFWSDAMCFGQIAVETALTGP